MQIGRLNLTRAEGVVKKADGAKKELQKNNLMQNPFGVSFKGNVIQADVFATSAKKESRNVIAEKSKLVSSAIVSGINNFNEAFSSRVNSIVSFGKKAVKNVFDSFDKLRKTDVNECVDNIKNQIFPDRKYSVKNLEKREVDDLKSLWADLTPECSE